MGKRSAEVAAQIEKAFSGVPHPGDARLLHPQCYDDMDIQAFYGGRHWRDIPEKVIARANAALCFFSPEGFQFYLPAYMLFALRHYRSSSSFSVDSTIYALCPSKGDLEQFSLSKFSLLTGPQREAVVAFLEVMIEEAEGHADTAIARRALSRYWRRRGGGQGS